MSWLANLIRPKIKHTNNTKKNVPDNLWHKCPGCGEMLFHRDYAANHNVCHHCNHHGRINVNKRLELLFSNGHEKFDLPKVAIDPLKFKDRKKYSERHKEAEKVTGEKDALIIAKGNVEATPMVAAIFNFEFMAGSMGVAVGEGIVKAVDIAIESKLPFVIIPASGGARMQESILSLMQMARTTIAVQKLKEAGLPYFVLLTDPTTGGVTASFAMLGDITFSEPQATIGFAGKRVIEETIREQLPEGFQTAEYLLEHGMIDYIVTRTDIPKELAKCANILMKKTAV